MPSLDSLAQVVAEKTGFEAHALSEARLLSLVHLLAKDGCEAGAETAHPRLEELAAEVFSVGETYFYRQSEHFEFLQQRGGELLLQSRPLLAWSAGCATGEEAWSMAATLSSILHGSRPLEVLGTDMSAKNLALATAGRYGKWSLRRESRGLPQALTGSSEEMHVLDELKGLVRFQRANLLDEAPLGGRKADIIFCRNVLIYLGAAAARKVVRHLCDALAEGGWLFLGSVDIDFRPPGLELEEPRILQIWRKPMATLAPAPELPAHPAAAAALARAGSWPSAPYDPKQAHLKALELQESGQDGAAMQSLRDLRARAKDYLPGLFDLGLALSRRGSKREAAEAFEELLAAAQGRDLATHVDGPEPVSLNFYVTSAQAFLERHGKGL